ncbi:MAG: site-specific integrase [Prevotellaceae bacterium]|jgi:site-specific recombinase XerD|nr:site-specific integrase [Prevotellaceae bacterium]
MATIVPYIRIQKNDGTYRVLIKITHQKLRVFIPTEIYVSQKDINNKNQLKKNFSSIPLEKIIYTYRNRIAELGTKIKAYSANDIKHYLLKSDRTDGGKYIDFIKFCEHRNTEILRLKGKNGTWYANHAAIEWLKVFIKDSALNVNTINRALLKKFESFLIEQNVGSAGISSYLRALRTMFILCMDEYNDEQHDEYIIKHYPFRRFKITEHHAEKRSVNIEDLKKIISFDCKAQREHLGKDMFLLTFFLAGIAPVDLFSLSEIKGGYIEYYRNKVKHRDNKIKVKIFVCRQAVELIEKYSTEYFLSDIKKYRNAKNFARACSKGLENICSGLGMDKVTLYRARHTFATFAAELGFDTNLIDYTLGHAPSRNAMAEVYITRTQTAVDNLVKKVIEKLIE